MFRHGVTYSSKHGIPYGAAQETAQILDEGRPSIERLGKHLKETTINTSLVSFYTSPLLRCRQTSEIITKNTGIEVILDQNLREIDENLEDFEIFISRIAEFINKSESSQIIWVCTHGACLAALKNLLTDNPLKPKDLLDYPKPGVLWEINDGVFTHKAF